MPLRGLLIFTLLSLSTLTTLSQPCQKCYDEKLDSKCAEESPEIKSHMLHMSVHPHLDAFWIFDFETYYELDPDNHQAKSYFQQNRFSSVREIFDTAYEVLSLSRSYREKGNGNEKSQRAHRSFFNSEIGFFKRWYSEQSKSVKDQVKELIKSGYWEIVGGGYVEHDEGCAYYEDIIENYEMGLRFLKNQLEYTPKAAISADSFGHSQSTLAILAHIGVEGFFVQRSDEHILLQNKTQFIWRAKSSNGKTYGALPTHIRWAIHGFQDQFASQLTGDVCINKKEFLDNMRQQNEFLKRILKSSHIMRYFGHDFQKFGDDSYVIIEEFMQQFSKEKCAKVAAMYGNPTDYFKTLMGEVFNKVKPVAYRNQDIFPIWDYDSGLYWTGYFTTDPFHKKYYRDCGRLLSLARKALLPLMMSGDKSSSVKQAYQNLEQFAEVVSYLQHHDGVSGTSKYSIMDAYEEKAEKMVRKIEVSLLKEIFATEYPLGSTNPILTCGIFQDCVIPESAKHGDVFLKLFNSGSKVEDQTFMIALPLGTFYKPDCEFEVLCPCYSQPCSCTLILTSPMLTFMPVRLTRVQSLKNVHYLKNLPQSISHEKFEYSDGEIIIKASNSEKIRLSYKTLSGESTSRRYKHLNRYGQETDRSVSIRSGKYALGNDPKTEKDLATIRRVAIVESSSFTKMVVTWNHNELKTVITHDKRHSQQWKIETLSNADGATLLDYYLQVKSEIKNGDAFYTDSNGWLVMERRRNHHEDYSAYFSPEGYDDVDGNTYPMTAFAFIKDQKKKLSINTDRPQGVISPKEGVLWVNFDRISSDDGKWVYENTYRNEYQRFTHFLTFGDANHNQQRVVQDRYDQPIIAQINEILPTSRVEIQNFDVTGWKAWAQLSGSSKTKFWLRPYNDSSVMLRIQNNADDAEQKICLFAGKISPYLTSYFGNVVEFGSIKEMSMGGHMKYSQFVEKKWNWDSVVNLDEENEIFNKNFAENITLRPLEIRTFKIENIKFSEKCMEVIDLKFNGEKTEYKLDTKKPGPSKASANAANQEQIIEYLRNGDHCKDESPVLYSQTLNQDLKDLPKPPPPTGRAKKREQSKEFSQENPQKLPTDIKSEKSFYEKEKMLPKKKQPKIEDNIEFKSSEETNIQVVKSKKEQSESAEQKKTPNVQKKYNELIEEADRNPIEEVRQVRHKVLAGDRLTRYEKELYFANKLNKVMKKLEGE